MERLFNHHLLTLCDCFGLKADKGVAAQMNSTNVAKQQAEAESLASCKVSVLMLFLENGKIVLSRGDDGLLDGFARVDQAGVGAGKALEEMALKLGVEVDARFIASEGEVAVFFATVPGLELPNALKGSTWEAMTLRVFYALADLGVDLRGLLGCVRGNVIQIPYLYFSENDYVYRFRTEKQRNRDIYHIDEESVSLYRSKLCLAIKELKRARERTATSPAVLDFGATRFALPSHFGFCLGVQNAIERAYETLAENPGRRVFMLSELIHNPFVNEDLKARGLRYLQSDKGVPAVNEAIGETYWDSLSDEDVVIIPAFGARDEDKVRLVESGIAINRYDATCMLVEKVWKAARRYGRQGYTVVIHGKAEHEETKATFSNSSKYAPSLIVRDLKEAQILADAIRSERIEEKRQLFELFRDRCSSGFELENDLGKLAIINQTTLLRNETLKIIQCLETALLDKYGKAHVEEHMAMSSKGDTLCYATQVNQDALTRALDEDVDVAIVVGGKNSSNTYQLYRLCESKFGDKAFYIQSERNILSATEIEHFVFPYNPRDSRQGRMETRPFIQSSESVNVLLTGGASCPDGILQTIIARINSFFPKAKIREIDDVIEDLS